MKLTKLAAAVGIFATLAAATPVVALARHGADDRAGHVRGGHDGQRHGGHGADDGPRHR